MIGRRTRGFTLVELMVAIAVASLLAATALVTLWGAQQQATDARAHAQVAKINDLVMPQWETYPTRKLTIFYSPAAFSPTPRDKLQARLVLLRDLMRMELPDRITDLSNPKVTLVFRDNAGNFRGQAALFNEPHVWRAYLRRCYTVLGPDPSTPSQPDWAKWNPLFQGAECLYLILSELREDDSPALAYFRDTEITDVDNDGMLEVSDGWGNPISFLRWAPGFISDVQYLSRDRQPDHLDPLHTDPRWDPSWVHINPALKAPYTLFPLIYSAGPDRTYGLITDNAGPPMHSYVATAPVPMDPYAPLGSGDLIGNIDLSAPTGAAQDNITNHYIEVR